MVVKMPVDFTTYWMLAGPRSWMTEVAFALVMSFCPGSAMEVAMGGSVPDHVDHTNEVREQLHGKTGSQRVGRAARSLPRAAGAPGDLSPSLRVRHHLPSRELQNAGKVQGLELGEEIKPDPTRGSIL